MKSYKNNVICNRNIYNDGKVITFGCYKEWFNKYYKNIKLFNKILEFYISKKEYNPFIQIYTLNAPFTNTSIENIIKHYGNAVNYRPKSILKGFIKVIYFTIFNYRFYIKIKHNLFKDRATKLANNIYYE